MPLTPSSTIPPQLRVEVRNVHLHLLQPLSPKALPLNTRLQRPQRAVSHHRQQHRRGKDRALTFPTPCRGGCKQRRALLLTGPQAFEQ
jgi:hypothetical protein